jgi:small subunit ribosomal protein S8
LKYVQGDSVIHEITRKSTPGRRHYEKINKLKKVVGGLGVAIMSTSSGLVTDRKAREMQVGGEIICHVW